jgi:type I restriction enzyme M protein
LPKADNANYLWIEIFYSALNAKGRAGFVMANSAGDARGSELEIRRQLLQSHAVDVIVSIGPNFFYTVTLPCTLWFLDRGKSKTNRKDKVLFIDARHIFRQIDRAHRDFTPEQIEFISNIARLYREEDVETEDGSQQARNPSGIAAKRRIRK